MVQMIQEAIAGAFADIFRGIWDWVMGVSYWATCLSCILFLTLFAATKDKKFGRYTTIIFILWVFLKGFDSVL